MRNFWTMGDSVVLDGVSVPDGSREEVALDARYLVELMPYWMMSSAGWERVAQLLGSVQAALAAGNLPAARRAHQELARAGLLQAKRFGDGPDPDRLPMPGPVRQLADVLTDGLGISTGRPDVPTDGATGGVTDVSGQWMTRELAQFARRFFPLPVFDRNQVAFAGIDGDGGDGGDEVVFAGMRIVRRTVDQATVDVLVTTSGLARDGDVVGVAVEAEGERSLFLLPVWRDPAGQFVARVGVPASAERLDVSVTLPFPAFLLADVDCAAIRQSLDASPRSGRSAWRRIARSRDDSDEVRAAVVAGLG